MRLEVNLDLKGGQFVDERTRYLQQQEDLAQINSTREIKSIRPHAPHPSRERLLHTIERSKPRQNATFQLLCHLFNTCSIAGKLK